ncbi:MAG: DUF1648 domain-containing protein [Oscillospiraceae bacterium]|jgi:lysylphosphatidylglycerol synthetase-like protein (DUF2156 family)|nr:DUF1648 domain-containing protein [Oscillospiraceae bacterium]
MKKRRLHLIAGTAICAATVLLFLAFNDRLPENIPIQIGVTGNVSKAVPKPLFVFGFPIVFSVINLINNLPRLKRGNVSSAKFYIVPAIAAVLAASALYIALNISLQ